MAYEDPRKSERDRTDDKTKARQRDDDHRKEDNWDSQDDGDFRYTDWAAI